MTDWFTSDEHYDHINIIRFQNRPFKNIEEMREIMIANHNAVVKPEDRVWHLGDFSFAQTSVSQKIFNRLLGHKFLILGNHDRTNRLPKGWVSIDSMKQIEIDGKTIILCHYAMKVWDKSHHGSYQLYGHSHGHLPGTTQSQDVGVDCWNFTPVQFKDILKRMASNKQFTQEDYHGDTRS
jgi:calcineurin-like phosphoesterase family protein